MMMRYDGKAMKIYIVCPWFKTGGPENMHQLCHYINELKWKDGAYMHYVQTNHPGFKRGASLYEEYNHVRIAETIEDVPSNVVIVPEIMKYTDVTDSIRHARVAIWWLSYTNACIYGVLRENLGANPERVMHLFHSYYEYAMVRPHLHPHAKWFFVTEYITGADEEGASEDVIVKQLCSEVKQDIVCFNGNKDKLTPVFCQMIGVPFIAIKNMSSAQVQETLRKCKLYIDLGFHPGKDHLPREAALQGCVVITNKCGSAAYTEDVPIEEKVTFETELVELVPEVLKNYDHFFQKQAPYRTFIRNEKKKFEENIQHFLQTLG